MSLMIHGIEFEVVETDGPIGGREGTEREFLAHTDEGFSDIIVDGTMTDAKKQQALLHELTHHGDMSLPEFAVAQVSTGLFSIFTANGLDLADFYKSALDGPASMAQEERVAKLNDELADMPSIAFARVSRKSWHFEPDQYENVETSYLAGSTLPIREPGGTVNYVAAMMAATMLAAGTQGEQPSSRRVLAHRLALIFRDEIGEEPPTGLAELAVTNA